MNNRNSLRLPANGKRLIHDLTVFDLPEVPYLAAQNLPFTSLSLPTHVHHGRMEINLILKGERVYRVAGEDYHLGGNQVFITWPDEVHGSGQFLHGRGLHFWMQLALPRPGAPFLGLTAKRAAPLLDALWNLPRRHFQAVPELRENYATILRLYRTDPTPLLKARMAALLTEWLLDVVACADRPVRRVITPDIARVDDYLRKHPNRHFTVEELAGIAHLSESHFKRKFREQFGMPPGDCLQRRRLEAAVKLLSQGKSITYIAYDLGFSSSQHFSTSFKKYFGLSPLRWLRTVSDKDFIPNREKGKAGGKKDAKGYFPWVDEEGRLHGHICPEPKEA
ncbi:MAG: AraC family transcriptional regulator [Planctomycetes bacterium]|nr:AraC family transcriptional regulator [Planctomycetota bacterium]